MDLTAFKRGLRLYPQPVALARGRICRARTSAERLDATIKGAEVLTRYLAALAVSSFGAREKQEGPAPPPLKALEGNLSFGHFLAVIQAVSSLAVDHPLQSYFLQAFGGKDGKQGVADAALTSLLNLRNQEGHDLMSLSAAKADSLLKKHQPLELLETALQAVDSLLAHPLFLVESQTYEQHVFTARRLLFMGDAEPFPEELEVRQGLQHTKVLYLGVKSGALCLHPWLIWDLVEKRYSYGIYFLHATRRDGVKFTSVESDELERDGDLGPGLKRASISGWR